MAFWGVEVKPGNPFTHLSDSKGGRLHVSQATLGFGTGTKNSVVQCNVGAKCPVFLCSLFPEQSESCQLNLEFEEADEVVFSVIGPRSVHLTGYYLGASRHYKLDDESESYGEDIVDTDTEKSPGVSDEEEYEDSFIDDDELQVIAPSPAFSDGVAEETLGEGGKEDAKTKNRRLRKKYQSSQADEDDDCTSQQQAFSNGGTDVMDIEGEDMAVISSLVKSAARTRKPGAEEKAEKDTGQTIVKEMKAGHDNSAETGGKIDAILDSEPKRKPHEYNSSLPSTVENDAKPKKKTKKQPKEQKGVRARVEDEFFPGQVLTWYKLQQNETKVDQSSQDMALINGDAKKIGNDKGESQMHLTVPSDELICGIVAKTGKRKKKQTQETEAVGSESAFSNVNREDQTEPDKASENVEQDDSLKNEENQKQENDEGESQLHLTVSSDKLICGIVAKTGKRKKKQTKETVDESAFTNVYTEDQTEPDKARCENVEQDGSLENEENQKQANDEGGNQLQILLPSDAVVNGIVAKTGKRKKKQAKETKTLRADSPFNNGTGEDQAQPDEARCEIIEQDSLLKNEEDEKQANDEGENPLHLSLPSDELVHGIVAKTGRRKKKQAKEEKSLRVDIPLDNISREDKAQTYEARRGVNPLRSDALVHGIVAKTGKRKKKQAEEEKVNGADGTFSNFNGEDQAQPNEARCENIVQDNMLKNEEDQKQANDGNAVLEWPCIVLGLENVPQPKKKRKNPAKDEQNQMQTIKADYDSNDDQSGNENHNGKKNANRKRKKVSRRS
ncbi:uncharacterized protein [Euphorbia lathyris]|uniref:uncharacterized protein isoform X2 n=1 Tax=Euphorbia lathyris TaxID=212925 RepID=UPI00331310E1